ncbi:MAG: DUF3822 family protein [Bacteroidetes bacterium]|nr:DUF3822 family protein [Bacteroidota bacterium]
MESHIANYQLNHKIQDDNLDIDQIAQYHLSFMIGDSDFMFCITDPAKNKCLYLEDYTFSSIMLPDQLTGQLHHIFNNHNLLEVGFWKSVKLAVKNQKFTLIPNSLFKKENLQEYLSLNCDINQYENVFYYKHIQSNAVNIFAAENKIINWFISAYPSKTIEVIHQTCPLIEGFIHIGENTSIKNMFIKVDNSYVTIIITKNKKLEFCNTYLFTNPEDFIYYIMLVIEELKINPEKDPVMVWGEIYSDSELFDNLHKYIRNVSIGRKPSSLSFSYNFDEVPDHKYFDLYSMHLCE